MDKRLHGSIFDHDWLQFMAEQATSAKVTVAVPTCVGKCQDGVSPPQSRPDPKSKAAPKPSQPAKRNHGSIFDDDWLQLIASPNPGDQTPGNADGRPNKPQKGKKSAHANKKREDPPPAPQKRNHGSIYGNEWLHLNELLLTLTPKAQAQVPPLFLDCERESQDDIFVDISRLSVGNNQCPVKDLEITEPPKVASGVPRFFLDCDRECEDDIFLDLARVVTNRQQPLPPPEQATFLGAFNGQLCCVYSSNSLIGYVVKGKVPTKSLVLKLPAAPDQLVCIGDRGFVYLLEKELFWVSLDGNSRQLNVPDVRCLRSDPAENNAFLFARGSEIVKARLDGEDFPAELVKGFDEPVESFWASRVNLAVSFKRGGTRSLRLFSRICAYHNAEISSVGSIGPGDLFCDDSACYTISGRKVECVWGNGVNGSLEYPSWGSRLVLQGPYNTFIIGESRYQAPQKAVACLTDGNLICFWTSVDSPPSVYRLTRPDKMGAMSSLKLVKKQGKEAKKDLQALTDAVQKGRMELRKMNNELKNLTNQLEEIQSRLVTIGIPSREGCLALYAKRDFDGWAQMLVNLSDADICSMEEEIVALSKLDNDKLTCPTRVDLIYRLVDVLSQGTLSLAPPLWKICCKGDPQDPFFAFGLREVATMLTRKVVELYPRSVRSPKIKNALQILGHIAEAAKLK